ncbi:T9SS C-terminal target domain-containing protein [Pontibacter diazotrophicus]|uniref:T9SS C-terminal target domain-containing protein n=2 Tax=Pontibacter diazotrophicus TaxID=1400979 RepID=A0A3D8LEH0_9BACT|nr:T9SS C-terminal target domain-containing protein [Pontibacter diazotrophicus]
MYGFGILACLGMTSEALGQDVFINEIHYDNASADVNEAIEVAGPAGTDLTGWTLVLYNGNNGVAYDTEALAGVIPDQNNGFGTLYFPIAGIQNGSPDGVALVNAAGTTVQFLSYEGEMTAVGGPADGMNSTDIGVSEEGTTPENFSLQLVGTGRTYTDFTWAAEALSTFGSVNTGQSFGEGGGGTDPNPDPDPEPEPEPKPATAIVFINEIHYDNSGADEGEGVEVAGLAGTDLTGWQLVPYNGNNGGAYSTLTLSGTIPNQQSGFGTVFFPISGLQNGAPDGIALVDAAGNIIQFLSYEGTFAATDGPAAGLTSTDVGVEEGSNTPIGFSLQLTGTGSAYEDFTWAAENTATYSAVNNGQVFLPLQDIVFINEIHYDNDGADTGEAIEVAGRAGTDLSGWSLVLYNGNNGAPYNTTGLTGTIPNQNNGFGFISVTYPANGIQNGAPDGVALVNADGEVVQFLSYEGAFTAVGGPADGLESTNIGVEEPGTTTIGYSLQLTGAGFTYEDFTWSGPINSTFGAANVGQDFGGGTSDPEPVEPQEVTIAEARSLPLGTPVIVNGTLTATDQLGGPAFIQDSTGGIALFDYQVHAEDAFSIGDSIQVTASIGAFNQQVQLIDVTNLESFGPATQPIAPVQVSIAELNSSLEGQLVTIPNASFTDTRGLLFPESNYTITDGTATIDLRIDGDVESLVGREIPDNAVNITGVVGSFRGTLQLLPRAIEDLPGTTPYVAAGSEIPLSTTLDVMTWNMEFFGSTIPTFGPTDVQLQLQNAARLIDSLNADVIAVQEISDENLLQQLADMLGYVRVCSDRFSYSFNGPDPTFPEQRLCFLYNPEVITLVNERVIFEELYDAARSGDSTPLDTYPTSPSSFWSSGRLPYMITVDATIEGVTERVQLINIHAKSGANSSDLIRRSFDTQALKDTLDQYYPDANIILLGDYNDDVDESIGGGPSTYSNFVQAEDFRVVTSTLSEAGLRSFITRDNVIDHITISNELYDDYLAGSASLVIPFNWIENYANTTSDHLPVFTRFELTEPLMVDAGPDKLVYYGYAPEACTTLSASAATGGVAGYTYSWSNGQTGQTIEVCPQESTTYTLTVTDARGVSVSDEVQVCVVNVSCGNTDNPKVQVYYNPSGNEGKGHTLCVSENAVPAHLALGAVLGDGTATSCDGSPITPGAVNLKELFSLLVYPNPVADYLNIVSDKIADCEVEVMLYDINGNEVYKNSHSIRNGSLNIDIRNVRLSKGLNYLKVKSEFGTQTMRIIKN